MVRTGLLAALASVLAGGGTLAAGGTAAHAAADPLHEVVAASGRPIPGAYIVTLADGVEPLGFARSLQASPRFVYSAALTGFTATLNDGQLKALQRSPQVRSIEQDQVATVSADLEPFATQTVYAGGGLYGLDRVDQRRLPLSGSYTYTATAGNVAAYVIDTGISTGHPNFGGRAKNVYDAFGGNGQDCNGHGTHVAGTIGSKTFGVAKQVTLLGVRVLDCAGSGSNSGVIAGVDWVRARASKPAVANISLGGGYSSALNTAVSALASSGVSVAVAAGNDYGANACNYSPASASGVLTVAASNKTDGRAGFTNVGSCVELYAPGAGITSTWLNSGKNTISGTSMASPHVAGLMALYKASGDKSSSAVNSWIVSNATSGVISGNPSGTPNRLLFKGSL